MWQRPLPVLEASGSRLQLGWGKEGSAWWPELRSAFTCSLTSSQKGEKLAWSLQDFTGTVSPPWSASFQANLMEIPLIFVVASQYSYTQKDFFFNHPKLQPLKRCDIIFFFFLIFGFSVIMNSMGLFPHTHTILRLASCQGTPVQ